MEKQEIITFFDEHAAQWDAEMIRNEDVIQQILTYSGVTVGKKILDVATGTGVLIPDYLARDVGSVTAVDISSNMIRICMDKFAAYPNVSVLCGDIETMACGNDFDVVMLYNAFPHFPDPDHLIYCLAQACKSGGRVTIAHGMSREQIDAHHHGSASKISVGLMSADDLKHLMQPYLDVDIVISDKTMYMVSGVKV